MNFFTKLEEAIARNRSLLVVGLDPNPEMLPKAYLQGNPSNLMAGLQAWLQWIIEQTGDRVCAYKPTLGFYQALGVAGLELLDLVLATIPSHIPVILDAKHGDLNTSTVFARTIFQKWRVDAVTLTPYAGQDHAAPFLVYADKAVFILCHTSNPGAIALQEYPTSDNPFYLQVVREIQSWGTLEQLGLEVGTTNPNVLRKIRAIAPERIILLRSIWAEGGDLKQILQAGLNQTGDGLLIPVPQDYLAQTNLAEAVEHLNQEINLTREQVIKEGSSCQLWTTNVCFLQQHPHQDLILQLFDIGCLLFGDYIQASGATFSYYIDLRKIISNPQIFNQVLNAYAEILQNLTFDRIAGLPYGALPTATGLALNLNYPMIFPRKEVKAHGTRRVIEGNFDPGETVVVIDDILISGKSAIEGAAKLESAGLTVEDIVVFIDHEGGVKDRLAQQGYRAHSVLTISEITETLSQAGRITQEQYDALQI
ncbi:orotate phosphoribosyltransferase [Stanieria cyanosphaera PCC 7437]|uniref:Orotate phosphoribosyltransferase n=1 Tax=Stanieria cyanosphaera (strain ATCC 29371 / PCC 7437) TaxID=111780 RepID=K9XW45_STAC7|nr:bifunctional orotidine-5'-phosphate decarboxylase/orotate phosphoribosyltransferase [Stanieria cyanosphaera]AFZ36810.1 orotate phosphoribosyltransferase [Stanieria cyanosphaera PCC 7437]